MSEFCDKSVATVKESASRSALEASTKLSELFIEAASQKVDQKAFSAEVNDKLKDVLPQLSIVSFKNDKFMKYDTDGDGAVSDKEIDAAIKSDKTSQKDKLMLTHLAKQYEALKNQDLKDGKNGANANGITDKDVDTYLANNPSDRPVVNSDGSTSQNFGTWQQRNFSDGTIVKTADGKVFEFVPQGDWNRVCHWNGKEWVDKDGKPTDVQNVEIDEKHNVKVTHKDGSCEIHHPDGSYEIYDECGNKKCDVDAATAKATEDKKSEIQEKSKIESGKGPYDAAKKMLEAAGVSPLTHKMILKFARWLRDEVAHKQSFKTGEKLVGDNDWQRVANKINEMKCAQKK